MNDVKSLSHSKWRCKYHIVFAPKYRRQIIYRKLRSDIGNSTRIMYQEACRDFRGRMLPGSYSLVSGYSAAFKCVAVHGIFKKQK